MRRVLTRTIQTTTPVAHPPKRKREGKNAKLRSLKRGPRRKRRSAMTQISLTRNCPKKRRKLVSEFYKFTREIYKFILKVKNSRG